MILWNKNGKRGFLQGYFSDDVVTKTGGIISDNSCENLI